MYYKKGKILQFSNLVRFIICYIESLYFVLFKNGRVAALHGTFIILESLQLIDKFELKFLFDNKRFY